MNGASSLSEQSEETDIFRGEDENGVKTLNCSFEGRKKRRKDREEFTNLKQLFRQRFDTCVNKLQLK
jgi:hypothetical protein